MIRCCREMMFLSLPLFVAACAGCGCTSEAPPPLPIPKIDPQIVQRPLPPLSAGDFAAVRHFDFHYDVTLTGLPPGETARVWIPLATDDPQQRVTRTQTVVPGEPRETRDAKFGNIFLFFEAPADPQGEIPIEIDYQVQRVEALPAAGEEVTADEVAVFLSGSTPANTEKLLGKSPREGTPDVLARMAFGAVLRGAKPPQGDSGAASESDPSRANAEQFVDVCRTMRVPARLERGFVLSTSDPVATPVEQTWAKFAADGRWETVDLAYARANPHHEKFAFGHLSPDRIKFTTGRGFTLNPLPAATPTDVSLLPYVEVGGQPHTQMKTNFRAEDSPEPKADVAASTDNAEEETETEADDRGADREFPPGIGKLPFSKPLPGAPEERPMLRPRPATPAPKKLP